MWGRFGNHPTGYNDTTPPPEGFLGYKQALDLVQSPKWPGWKEGMVATNNNRSKSIMPYGLDPAKLPGGLVPDFHHPATQGWFTSWLRAIHPDMRLIQVEGRVQIVTDEDNLSGLCDSGGLALVSALLRCYKRKPTHDGWWWLQLEQGAPWEPVRVWQEEGKFYYRVEGEPVDIKSFPPSALWGPNLSGPA